MEESEISALQLVFLALPVGLLAAWLMNAMMRMVSRQREVPVHMVLALGSLITAREDHAHKTGLLIHSLAGMLFSVLYLALWQEWGMTAFKETVYLGLGFGFVHGLLTAYALMMVISERHPLERYRNASLAVGFIHLLGHLFFGFVVGFLGGIGFSIIG